MKNIQTDLECQNLNKIEIAKVFIDQVNQQTHAEELKAQAKLLTQLAHEIRKQVTEFMHQNKLSDTKDSKPSYLGMISILSAADLPLTIENPNPIKSSNQP